MFKDEHFFCARAPLHKCSCTPLFKWRKFITQRWSMLLDFIMCNVTFQTFYTFDEYYRNKSLDWKKAKRWHLYYAGRQNYCKKMYLRVNTDLRVDNLITIIWTITMQPLICFLSSRSSECIQITWMQN